MLSDVLWGTFLVSIFVSSLFNCLIFTFTVMVNSLKISFSSMFPSAGSQFWVFRMHFVESSFNSWKLLKLFPRRFAQILTYFSENEKIWHPVYSLWLFYGFLGQQFRYFSISWVTTFFLMIFCTKCLMLNMLYFSLLEVFFGVFGPF